MSVTRCEWATSHPLCQSYHDRDWGVPLHDDRALYELLILQCMQAGLSWITVLKKRTALRKAFDQFDYRKVARYGAGEIAALLDEPAIIRNRLKLSAAVANAQAFVRIREEFGTFDAYIWNFVGRKPVQNTWKSFAELPAKTALAETISQDLKKRGFRFVGPTVVYAFMQSGGIVNDHTTDCYRYREIRDLRAT